VKRGINVSTYGEQFWERSLGEPTRGGLPDGVLRKSNDCAVRSRMLRNYIIAILK
jgi:hypothetical protein